MSCQRSHTFWHQWVGTERRSTCGWNLRAFLNPWISMGRWGLGSFLWGWLAWGATLSLVFLLFSCPFSRILCPPKRQAPPHFYMTQTRCKKSSRSRFCWFITNQTKPFGFHSPFFTPLIPSPFSLTASRLKLRPRCQSPPPPPPPLTMAI